MSGKPINSTHQLVRGVAAFEAFKGVLALLAASGLFLLLHEDLHRFAIRLVEHAHLNPAARYPGIFIAAMSDLGNARLVLLALGAMAYALVRFVEAYGLFREAAWAEVLAAASGLVYLPFEAVALMRGEGWLSVAAIIVNVLIVAIMLTALVRRRSRPVPARD
ncbi:MAG: DUF2127 domain-containing protein [Pseudomonadales bacterium]